MLTLAAMLLVPATVLAQAEATPKPAESAALAAQEPQGYTYNPEGRRDPFVSLQNRGRSVPETVTAAASPIARPPGLAGLATSEVSLRGIVQGRSGAVGILQGADTKTYIVHPGGKLFDGTVRAITTDAMVILQQVDDASAQEKQREVRKTLRPHTPEAK
jgi:Tfp pilus assembly protein PilP